MPEPKAAAVLPVHVHWLVGGCLLRFELRTAGERAAGAAHVKAQAGLRHSKEPPARVGGGNPDAQHLWSACRPRQLSLPPAAAKAAAGEGGGRCLSTVAAEGREVLSVPLHPSCSAIHLCPDHRPDHCRSSPIYVPILVPIIVDDDPHDDRDNNENRRRS